MRHTRRGVLERTLEEFRELDHVVRSLKPTDWRRRVPRPEGKEAWTVKDALAHVVHWKEHTTRVFRGDKRPLELRGLEVNAINHIIYQRWRRRPPSQVLAWHRRVHEDVMRTLRATPEEYFSAREHGADWPGDFTSHSAWHRRRDIEVTVRRD